MTDTLTPAQRRRNMAAIKNKHTHPEMVVRRITHGMGYRYRLHCEYLPGKPDLVFPGRRKIIEVYGCFWHMHDCIYGRVTPRTNTEFWQNKRLGTVSRDHRNIKKLEEEGWQILVIWECETKTTKALQTKIRHFLDT